jgi:transcriptional regulator with XRE-family HTH domain
MSDTQQELQRLGTLFRQLRLQKGWTLEQTEDHGRHDWKYLQKIESGRNITLMTFFKICELYGVKTERVLKSFESTLKQ